ncbi:MAG: extracellular solute-binding protein [Thalassospira sp.]|uniref:extracellular solute-binding protein n=1 Tax=Thalassospira sp. TaxID=1912094 RepID=UPI0032EF61AF
MDFRPFRLFLCVGFFAAGFGNIAKADGEVNVYTERQPEFVQPVFERFTKATGIAVNVLYSQTDLVDRIVREGTSTPADVLLAVNVGRLVEAGQSGIAEPINDALVAQNIPPDYRDKDNLWVGLTSRARVFVTSRDATKSLPITSYEELASPEFKGQICIRSGYHVYNLGLIGSMIARHDVDFTRDWLRFVKSNLARKPQGGDVDQIMAVARGECGVAIVNSYYYGKMLDDPAARSAASKVHIVFPNQEAGGTHMNITGVVLVKGAPNRINALRLIEFMSSSEIQHVYADANFEYPVGVVWPEMLRSWGEFTSERLPLTVIAGYQDQAKQLLDEVAFDD